MPQILCGSAETNPNVVQLVITIVTTHYIAGLSGTFAADVLIKDALRPPFYQERDGEWRWLGIETVCPDECPDMHSICYIPLQVSYQQTSLEF